TNALRERLRCRAIRCKSCQNSSSSEKLVAWPAIVTERLRRELAAISIRSKHRLRIDPAVEIFWFHIAERRGGLLQGLAMCQCAFRDLRRLVVADMRRQRRHQHQRAVKHRLDLG